MEFYSDLYISDSLKKKRNKLIRDIKHKKASANIYVITLPFCDHNQMEFYSASMLKQGVFDKEDLFVIGIADGYDGAKDLIPHIFDDVYTITNDQDVRRYLEDSRQKGGK